MENAEPPMWTLTYYKRPWTLNSERAGGRRGLGGHYGRATATKEWRQAFKLLAIEAKIPKLKSVDVEIQPISKTRNFADVCSCIGAEKAAVDGVVDAGVLPDDSGEYVTSVKFYPPVKGDKDALVVTLIGEPE
jgi:hypothetical protein